MTFEQEIPVIARHDVCVVGGGAAGIAAATAAARNGADTILVERYGFLGGTATAGLVGPFMTSYSADGAEPVIAGIFREVVDRMVAVGGALDPGGIEHSTAYTAFIKLGHARVTPYHPEALKMAAIETIVEAGANPLFHTSFIKALAEDGRIGGIVTHNKGGLGVIEAGAFVDASADADVATDSGVPYTKGRPSDGKMMPATMFMRIGNVDDEAVERYGRAHPGERIFASIVTQARAEGRWDLPREALNVYREPSPGEYRANISRLHDIDGTNPDDLSRAEVEGRRQCLFIFEFMKANCPGFDSAKLLETAAQIGIRETRHIEGRYTLTAEDVLTGRRFDDAIARCAFPIDIHDPTGSAGQFIGLGSDKSDAFADTPPDVPPFYDIPYRTRVPVGMRNLVVAGRPISATHEAAGSLRVIPPCFATGEAAGTAAALAVREDRRVGFADLDTDELRQQLRAQGAIV